MELLLRMQGVFAFLLSIFHSLDPPPCVAAQRKAAEEETLGTKLIYRYPPRESQSSYRGNPGPLGRPWEYLYFHFH